MDYIKLLKDPRWQKKRLDIMARDKWKCVYCGDPYETLYVHHTEYTHSKKPWEYDDSSLLTLCLDCHTNETKKRRMAEDNLLKSFRRNGFSAEAISIITEGINNLTTQNTIFTSAVLEWVCSNPQLLEQLEKLYRHYIKGDKTPLKNFPLNNPL